jgi:ribonucleoside-triphosphate reductase
MIKVSNVQNQDNFEKIDFVIENLDTANTTRTLRNIKKALIYSLRNEYQIKDKDKLNELSDFILRMNGLHIDNFDFVKNIETLINEELNSVSLDDNSNKNEKTIKGLIKEAEIAVDKAIGADLLYRVMKELYGKEEAKRLSGLMYDYSLGLSDSTQILSPYCWALDASKIVLEGRNFGQLHSAPSKRLSSYVSALSETVHQLSSHLAGAIAIGTFFLDIANVLIYKEQITIEQVKEDKVIRKYIENEMQQFVHSVNHLSRNSVESPFSNISIFDKPKLKELVYNHYNWYFEKLKDKTQEETFEYAIQYIIEVQNIYMKFFEKGNPLKNGEPFRFPVSTLNISKSIDENGNNYIEDKEFLKTIISPEIFRYNIFASGGSKISSCCRLLSDMDMLDLASQSNSFGGGGSISLGSHRVVTTNFARIAVVCNDYEDYFCILEKRIEASAKILKAHKQLLALLTQKGLQPFISNGWIQLQRMFSTFGVLGIVEANEILLSRFKELKDKDVIGDILEFFNTNVLEYSKEYGIHGNIEQIPGESYSIRLAKVDNKMFNTPYKIYANQFIPLWDQKSSVWQRMDIDGKYNKKLTGGGITHLNIGEKLTKKQIEQLIEYSIKSGCEHFSLNPTYSRCEDDHVNMGKFTKCPICQKKIVDYVTRVVGFFTPVSSWKHEKVEYDFNKRKIYFNEDFNKEV